MANPWNSKDFPDYKWKFFSIENPLQEGVLVTDPYPGQITPSVTKFFTNPRVGSGALWGTSHGNLIRDGILNARVGNIKPNVGGHFYLQKTHFDVSRVQYVAKATPYIRGTKSYKGPILPTSVPIMDGVYPPLGLISLLELQAFGQTLKARAQPSNVNVSLFNAVGELYKDGIPTITGVETWKNRVKVARSAGSEYLNVEFGWKPLINDIRGVASQIKNASLLLAAREKNNGQPVRSSARFPTVTSSGKAVYPFEGATSRPAPASESVWMGYPIGKVYRERTTSLDVWFSGCFAQWTSPGSYSSSLARYVEQADVILGIKPTPDRLWDLAPWTWAIDWHVNFGAMLQNLSAAIFDGSIMYYGYVMAHNRTIDTYTHEYHGSSYSVVKEEKMRASSYPFGFGLSPSQYTDRQKAIIAALGATRL